MDMEVETSTLCMLPGSMLVRSNMGGFWCLAELSGSTLLPSFSNWSMLSCRTRPRKDPSVSCCRRHKLSLSINLTGSLSRCQNKGGARSQVLLQCHVIYCAQQPRELLTTCIFHCAGGHSSHARWHSAEVNQELPVDRPAWSLCTAVRAHNYAARGTCATTTALWYSRTSGVGGVRGSRPFCCRLTLPGEALLESAASSCFAASLLQHEFVMSTMLYLIMAWRAWHCILRLRTSAAEQQLCGHVLLAQLS